MDHGTDSNLTHPQELTQCLQKIARRRHRIKIGRAGLRVLWGMGVVMLALTGLDAWGRWPPAGQYLGMAIGGALTLAALGWAARVFFRPCWAADEIRGLEKYLQVREGTIRSGWELRVVAAFPISHQVNAASGEAGEKQGLTALLARRAVEESLAWVRGVDPGRYVSARGLRREGAMLLAVVLLATAVMWIWPGVVERGLPRLAAPWRDLPAFAWSRVEAWQEAGLLRARVEGLDARRAEMTALDASGRQIMRWEMQRTPSGEFTHDLSHLKEAMLVQVKAGDGWSQRVLLRPMTAQPADGEPRTLVQERAAPGASAANAAASATQPEKPAFGGGAAGGSSGGEGKTAAKIRTPPEVEEIIVHRGTVGMMDPMESGKALWSMEAVMSRVPEGYRTVTAQYFERLERDQKPHQPAAPKTKE